MGCGSRSSRAPRPWGLGRLRRRWWLLADHVHLRQGCRTPDLLSLQDGPHEALVRGSHVRQAIRHVNVAMGRTLAASHLRGPEALLRRGSIEPWYVDADAQPAILAWMGSCARSAAVAAHGSCILQLLSVPRDEPLRVWPSLPHTFLRETRLEARLQVVPERLPRDLGKVGGSPRKSPRALPKEGTGRAFLCDRGWRPLNRRGS